MSDLIEPQQPIASQAFKLLLAPEHVQLVRTVLVQQVPQARVFAFGSRVSGKPRKYSDLDLAISLPEPIGLRKLRELKDAFEDSALPICVDIVDWTCADAAFQAEVLSRGMAALQ